MHQESVSPPTTLQWQNRCKYFGTLESTESLQLPEEGLDGKLWLVLVNFSS